MRNSILLLVEGFENLKYGRGKIPILLKKKSTQQEHHKSQLEQENTCM